MILLTIDPSSMRTGYAVTTGPGIMPIDAGIITPARARDDAMVRIGSMVEDVVGLIQEHHPDVVLLEKPTGKVHRRVADSGGGAGLSIYGVAMGAIWQAVRQEMPPRGLQTVDTTWTGGKKKEHRARVLMSLFPGLDLSGDKGLDMADAIGLSVWWWTKHPGGVCE